MTGIPLTISPDLDPGAVPTFPRHKVPAQGERQSLLASFPSDLLEDIVHQRCTPFVGAGFSRNAIVPSLRARKALPLWKDIGEALAADLRREMGSDDESETKGLTPLEIISTYAHVRGERQLIHRLMALIHFKDARPGPTHLEFGKLPFEVVCTTNFDLLLERAYGALNVPFHKTVREEDLSHSETSGQIDLVKLHGDFGHKDRMVLTESDYARALKEHPGMMTFLANTFATRSALFLGYSLDDPDIRHIWQTVRERLGTRGARRAWVVLWRASRMDCARFERRGIHVINYTAEEAPHVASYEALFNELFVEMRRYWSYRILMELQVSERRAKAAFFTPRTHTNRLCMFLVGSEHQYFYQSEVFPRAEFHGFVPFNPDQAQGGSDMARFRALMSRSEFFVLDVREDHPRAPFLDWILSDRRCILIVPEGTTDRRLLSLPHIFRPKRFQADDERDDPFLGEVDTALARLAAGLDVRVVEGIERLLREGKDFPDTQWEDLARQAHKVECGLELDEDGEAAGRPAASPLTPAPPSADEAEDPDASSGPAQRLRHDPASKPSDAQHHDVAAYLGAITTLEYRLHQYFQQVKTHKHQRRVRTLPGYFHGSEQFDFEEDLKDKVPFDGNQAIRWDRWRHNLVFRLSRPSKATLNKATLEMLAAAQKVASLLTSTRDRASSGEAG